MMKLAANELSLRGCQECGQEQAAAFLLLLFRTHLHTAVLFFFNVFYLLFFSRIFSSIVIAGWTLPLPLVLGASKEPRIWMWSPQMPGSHRNAAVKSYQWLLVVFCPFPFLSPCKLSQDYFQGSSFQNSGSSEELCFWMVEDCWFC